jgi:extradiol dioxygenase family protein
MLEDATAIAVIPVHDLGKARTFYEKMLGLTPGRSARSEGETIYQLGETELMVYETKAELGGATKVTLVVKDLGKEMADLRAHGIRFEELDMPNLKTTNGVIEDEQGKAAWFKDLEGNWIALSQPNK